MSVRKEEDSALERVVTSMGKRGFELVVGGDFNTIVDEIDATPINHYRREQIMDPFPNSLCTKHTLVDVWRTHHPHKLQYTFHRTDTASRIDFIFLSHTLLPLTSNARITDALGGDHMAVAVDLGINRAPLPAPINIRNNNFSLPRDPDDPAWTKLKDNLLLHYPPPRFLTSAGGGLNMSEDEADDDSVLVGTNYNEQILLFDKFNSLTQAFWCCVCL